MSQRAQPRLPARGSSGDEEPWGCGGELGVPRALLLGRVWEAPLLLPGAPPPAGSLPPQPPGTEPQARAVSIGVCPAREHQTCSSSPAGSCGWAPHHGSQQPMPQHSPQHPTCPAQPGDPRALFARQTALVAWPQKCQPCPPGALLLVFLAMPEILCCTQGDKFSYNKTSALHGYVWRQGSWPHTASETLFPSCGSTSAFQELLRTSTNCSEGT